MDYRHRIRCPFHYIPCGTESDVYEGALLEPARQGHRGDPVGGQPPPYKVPPVWHANAVEGPEWDAQTHGTMHLGSGAKDTNISGGGG